jgi:hypothetical protein
MDQISIKDDPARLLWTGGWDSTFQLLRLLLLERRCVKPYYILDAERKSTGAELLTMKRIKDRLVRESPSVRNLLQATHFAAAHELLEVPEITQTFQKIRRDKYLGTQYDWLPRFCHQCQITQLQLCIHKDDKAHAILQGLVTEAAAGDTSVLRMDPKFEGTDESRLFSCFLFPLFEFSKTQMAEFADRHGWREIMDMTWFCHTPTRKLTPCGRCKPCIYTIEEGLGRRIPLRARIGHSLFRRWLRPIKLSATRIGGMFRPIG